jgi:hypothetical protein
MKKTTLALAVASAVAVLSIRRAYTGDVAYGFRMGAGFPGDVNRTHPASIIPGMNSPTNPARLFGDPVLVDTATNSYRGFLVGDTAITQIDGIAVRPYPTQQTSGGLNAAFGNGAPAANQPLDVLEAGFIMVKVNGTAVPTKKGPVFVWIAASTGTHVQGGFEAAATGGSTVAITNAFFNGPPDANGVTELRVSALL